MAARADSILIVEEDTAVRDVLKKLLTASGYTVRTATGRDRVIAELENNASSLVLLDSNLPDTSGVEICHAIRAHQMTQ